MKNIYYQKGDFIDTRSYYPILDDLEEENKKLRDNWSKLKQWIESKNDSYGDMDDYDMKIVLNKMNEIERGENENI